VTYLSTSGPAGTVGRKYYDSYRKLSDLGHWRRRRRKKKKKKKKGDMYEMAESASMQGSH
jgi:hypothetical protein